MMAAQAVEFDIELNYIIPVEFPELLVGDGARLRQLITNLLSNALKFSKGGKVLIEASCISESAEEVIVQIKVADTGIGIPADQRAAIFESFTQVDGSSTRRYGGAGLGLTITKQIVGLMGGTIDLETEVGKGSTFTLEIPFEKQNPIARRAIPTSVPSTKEAPLKLKILLAEDNPVNAMVACGRLQKWGCTCVTVENGCETLLALEKDRYDVVLMDISMPEMDGLQATREVREREKTSGDHVPIIAMTAHALPGDRERCLEAGMDEYVSKPVNFDELRAKLSAYVN